MRRNATRSSPSNPYGNVYGQPRGPIRERNKQQAADAVKLPDDLSKDGAGSSQARGAMPAGGVPPYAAAPTARWALTTT